MENIFVPTPAPRLFIGLDLGEFRERTLVEKVYWEKRIHDGYETYASTLLPNAIMLAETKSGEVLSYRGKAGRYDISIKPEDKPIWVKLDFGKPAVFELVNFVPYLDSVIEGPSGDKELIIKCPILLKDLKYVTSGKRLEKIFECYKELPQEDKMLSLSESRLAKRSILALKHAKSIGIDILEC